MVQGQAVVRANITGMTQSKPCQITVDDATPFNTGDNVRITDLNSMMPVIRGMDEINNKRFQIYITSGTTFNIFDPITNDPIDSTTYPAYVTGGRVDLVNHNFIYQGP